MTQVKTKEQEAQEFADKRWKKLEGLTALAKESTFKERYIEPVWSEKSITFQLTQGFLAGHASRDSEVATLKAQNRLLTEQRNELVAQVDHGVLHASEKWNLRVDENIKILDAAIAQLAEKEKGI